MEKITLTCPFTGIPFDAIKSADGSLIVQNPITKENMRIGYNEPTKRYLVNKKYFQFMETVSCSEAAEMLGVSRSRISTMIFNDTIPHYSVNGKHVFLKSDVLSYSESRRVGRPQKDGY